MGEISSVSEEIPGFGDAFWWSEDSFAWFGDAFPWSGSDFLSNPLIFYSFPLCFISLLGGGPDPDILVDLLDPPMESLIFYIGRVILSRNSSFSS